MLALIFSSVITFGTRLRPKDSLLLRRKSHWAPQRSRAAFVARGLSQWLANRRHGFQALTIGHPASAKPHRTSLTLLIPPTWRLQKVGCWEFLCYYICTLGFFGHVHTLKSHAVTPHGRHVEPAGPSQASFELPYLASNMSESPVTIFYDSPALFRLAGGHNAHRAVRLLAVSRCVDVWPCSYMDPGLRDSTKTGQSLGKNLGCGGRGTGFGQLSSRRCWRGGAATLLTMMRICLDIFVWMTSSQWWLGSAHEREAARTARWRRVSRLQGRISCTGCATPWSWV